MGDVFALEYLQPLPITNYFLLCLTAYTRMGRTLCELSGRVFADCPYEFCRLASMIHFKTILPNLSLEFLLGADSSSELFYYYEWLCSNPRDTWVDVLVCNAIKGGFFQKFISL